MNKVGIVMPFYGKWDLCHARLFEFYQFLPQDNVEIILVDDASPDEEEIKGSVSWWQKDTKHHKIRYYRNEENLGFGGAMNVGAKIAMHHSAEIIMLISNDVKVSGDFVSPVVYMLNINDKLIIGSEVIDYPAGWNEFEINNEKIVVPWVNGWFIACTSEIWKMLGGFDPLYGKYTYEDIDLSTRATMMGLELVATKSPFLKHLGAQTAGYSAERMEITIANKEKYLHKWDAKLLEIYKK